MHFTCVAYTNHSSCIHICPTAYASKCTLMHARVAIALCTLMHQCPHALWWVAYACLCEAVRYAIKCELVIMCCYVTIMWYYALYLVWDDCGRLIHMLLGAFICDTPTYTTLYGLYSYASLCIGMCCLMYRACHARSCGPRIMLYYIWLYIVLCMLVTAWESYAC